MEQGPLRISAYTAEHVPAVQAMLDDPDVLRFTPIPGPVPEGHAQRYLSMPAWAALLHGVVAGVGMAPVADRVRAEFELGYLVHRDHRGRGVALALLRHMTDWALGEGAERVVLHISADNLASQAVARRAGFQLEGLLRSTYLKPGRREDSTVWSRLPRR